MGMSGNAQLPETSLCFITTPSALAKKKNSYKVRSCQSMTMAPKGGMKKTEMISLSHRRKGRRPTVERPEVALLTQELEDGDEESCCKSYYCCPALAVLRSTLPT